MEPRNFEKLLTPAAHEMLEELIQTLRHQLVRGAAEAAVRSTGAIREISVSDLARSYSLLQPASRVSLGRVGFFERALKLYSLTGALVGLVAGLFYIYTRFLSGGQLPFSPDTALAVAAAGGLITLTTYVLREILSFRRFTRSQVVYRQTARYPSGPMSPERPSEELVGEFLLLWQDLEVSIQSLASSFLGESAASAPLSVSLRELRGAGALPNAALRELAELLQLRNKIVHSAESVSTADLLEGIAMAERIRERYFRPAQPAA